VPTAVIVQINTLLDEDAVIVTPVPVEVHVGLLNVVPNGNSIHSSLSLPLSTVEVAKYTCAVVVSLAA
jgi:hypothetical protein